MRQPSIPHARAGTSAAANRRGIIALTVAMTSFMVNDGIVKFVSQTLNGIQLIFIRGVFATLFLLSVAHIMGATPRLGEILRGRIALRSILDTLATLVFLTGLFHLPLANATAIGMAAPLFLCLLARLFLHEPMNHAHWIAILGGFGGVLLVVQPQTSGFNAWALMCVIGTFIGSARDLVTRTVPSTVPSILLTVATAVFVTAVSAPLSLIQGWRPVGLKELALLASASVFLAIGFFLLITSLREGDMSVIAPFRYTALLSALVIGYLVWGDVPNSLAWAGIGLLVASGVYLLHSERRRNHAALETAADQGL